MKCNQYDNLEECITVGSRSHGLQSEKNFLTETGISLDKSYKYGSFGLKCCHIADGKADLYINFSGKTSYWDSAPGCIILKESGGSGMMNVNGRVLLDGFDIKNKLKMYGTTNSLLTKITKCFIKSKF
jgi:3'(2'), 5'-bisphosphate nucleotidase